MALSLKNVGGLFFGQNSDQIKLAQEQKSSELGRLNSRIDAGVTGLTRGGQLTQDLISRVGDNKIAQATSLGQGNLINSSENASLRGAGNPAFFNRLSTLNNLSTGLQQGNIAGSTIDANAQAAIGDFGQQQGFINNATVQAAGLGQGINSRNASAQNKLNQINTARSDVNNANLGIFGDALTKVASNAVGAGQKGLFAALGVG